MYCKFMAKKYLASLRLCFFFFYQAEDGIRDLTVTGVTCALPISRRSCNRLPSVTYPGRNSLPGATGPRANEGPYQETGLSWLRSRRAYSTYSLNADGRRREADRKSVG